MQRRAADRQQPGREKHNHNSSNRLHPTHRFSSNSQGTSEEHYNTIVKSITHTADKRCVDAAGLSRWYRGLAKCASLIKADRMITLLQAIFAFDFEAPSTTIKDYCALLVNLSTARGQLLVPCIRKLVKAFLPNPNRVSEAPSPRAHVASLEDLQDRVHRTLERLLKLSPIAASSLFPLLVEHYPHMRLDVYVQQVYVKSLLRVVEYAPALRDRVITVIVERLIYMDVQIKIGDAAEEAYDDDGSSSDESEGSDDEDKHEEEYKEAGEEESTLLFAFSDSPPDHSPVPLPEGGLDITIKEDLDPNRIMADKLDTLMCLVFEYLSLVSRAGDPKLCNDVFNSLLKVFERSILKTHKSRFTQFLLFFICSVKHTYTEAFLRKLLEITFNINASVSERMSAVSYAASFVARASYLRSATTAYTFEILLQWVHEYIELFNEERNKSGNMGEHAVFYGICQAVFYIFCHRQQSLTETHGEESEAGKRERYKLDVVVSSQLNPLRYCDATVVAEFAAQAERTGVALCRGIMEENSRTGGSGAPRGANHSNAAAAAVAYKAQAGGHFTHVEGFFPFDPYNLRYSSEHISGFYNNYDGSAGHDFFGVVNSPRPESPLLGFYSPGQSPYVPWSNPKNIGLATMPALNLTERRRDSGFAPGGRRRESSMVVGSLASVSSDMSTMSVSYSPRPAGFLDQRRTR